MPVLLVSLNRLGDALDDHRCRHQSLSANLPSNAAEDQLRDADEDEPGQQA